MASTKENIQIIVTVPCGDVYTIDFENANNLLIIVLEFAAKIGCKVEIVTSEGAHLNGNSIMEDMDKIFDSYFTVNKR